MYSAGIVLSSIVVAELYAGVKGDAELQTLDSFLSLFRVIPVSTVLARAGRVYKRDDGPSRGVGLADAIVGTLRPQVWRFVVPDPGLTSDRGEPKGGPLGPPSRSAVKRV